LNKERIDKVKVEVSSRGGEDGYLKDEGLD